jgi:hypothetical protein
VTSANGYTGTVTWSGSPATFAAATTYTATISLTPTSGYTLSGVSENFFTVAGAATDTNPANSGVITAVFPATAAGSATKVAITRASVGTQRRTAFTTQPQITIQDAAGNTVTSSSEVVTATVSAGATLVGTATATASSGIATFTGLGVDGINGTTYTITYTVSGLTVATGTVTLTGTTCDGVTFTCKVGDTGPGGGKIFYVALTTFTQVLASGSMCTSLCKYLEAAPTSGTNAWTDALYAWSGNTTTLIGANAQGTAIGTGYKNTLAIISQDTTANRAGTISQAYRGPNNLTDWYLASKDELAQLYEQKSTVGGFVAGTYWSSSEYDKDYAWAEFFNSGVKSYNGKFGSVYVRPVRAFGAGSAAKVAITRASVGTQRRTAFTTQPQITIQDSGGTTITSSAAVVTATVSAGGTLVGTTTSTASSGVATFTGLGVDGTIGTSYTITYTAVGLTIATATVTLTGTTCDGVTFTCKVGDTGPGGGMIFYYSAAGFSCGSAFSATGSPTGGKCYYLEVAPKTWDGAGDPLKPWAVTAKNNELVNATGDSNSVGIGLGYQNSDLIVVQNGTYNATTNNYAAGAARAYSGGSKNDWYLPAIPELNELYKWANSDIAQPALGTVGVDGTLNFAANGFTIEFDFAAVYYWSSSEDAPNHAWNQSFNYSTQAWNDKSDSRRVRPIRAF